MTATLPQHREETAYHVGDQVYDPRHGRGIVTSMMNIGEWGLFIVMVYYAAGKITRKYTPEQQAFNLINLRTATGRALTDVRGRYIDPASRWLRGGTPRRMMQPGGPRTPPKTTQMGAWNEIIDSLHRSASGSLVNQDKMIEGIEHAYSSSPQFTHSIGRPGTVGSRVMAESIQDYARRGGSWTDLLISQADASVIDKMLTSRKVISQSAWTKLTAASDSGILPNLDPTTFTIGDLRDALVKAGLDPAEISTTLDVYRTTLRGPVPGVAEHMDDLAAALKAPHVFQPTRGITKLELTKGTPHNVMAYMDAWSSQKAQQLHEALAVIRNTLTNLGNVPKQLSKVSHDKVGLKRLADDIRTKHTLMMRTIRGHGIRMQDPALFHKMGRFMTLLNSAATTTNRGLFWSLRQEMHQLATDISIRSSLVGRRQGLSAVLPLEQEMEILTQGAISGNIEQRTIMEELRVMFNIQQTGTVPADIMEQQADWVFGTRGKMVQTSEGPIWQYDISGYPWSSPAEERALRRYTGRNLPGSLFSSELADLRSLEPGRSRLPYGGAARTGPVGPMGMAATVLPEDIQNVIGMAVPKVSYTTVSEEAAERGMALARAVSEKNPFVVSMLAGTRHFKRAQGGGILPQVMALTGRVFRDDKEIPYSIGTPIFNDMTAEVELLGVPARAFEEMPGLTWADLGELPSEATAGTPRFVQGMEASAQRRAAQILEPNPYMDIHQDVAAIWESLENRAYSRATHKYKDLKVQHGHLLSNLQMYQQSVLKRRLMDQRRKASWIGGRLNQLSSQIRREQRNLVRLRGLTMPSGFTMSEQELMPGGPMDRVRQLQPSREVYGEVLSISGQTKRHAARGTSLRRLQSLRREHGQLLGTYERMQEVLRPLHDIPMVAQRELDVSIERSERAARDIFKRLSNRLEVSKVGGRLQVRLDPRKGVVPQSLEELEPQVRKYRAQLLDELYASMQLHGLISAEDIPGDPVAKVVRAITGLEQIRVSRYFTELGLGTMSERRLVIYNKLRKHGIAPELSRRMVRDPKSIFDQVTNPRIRKIAEELMQLTAARGGADYTEAIAYEQVLGLGGTLSEEMLDKISPTVKAFELVNRAAASESAAVLSQPTDSLSRLMRSLGRMRAPTNELQLFLPPSARITKENLPLSLTYEDMLRLLGLADVPGQDRSAWVQQMTQRLAGRTRGEGGRARIMAEMEDISTMVFRTTDVDTFMGGREVPRRLPYNIQRLARRVQGLVSGIPGALRTEGPFVDPKQFSGELWLAMLEGTARVFREQHGLKPNDREVRAIMDRIMDESVKAFRSFAKFGLGSDADETLRKVRQTTSMAADMTWESIEDLAARMSERGTAIEDLAFLLEDALPRALEEPLDIGGRGMLSMFKGQAVEDDVTRALIRAVGTGDPESNKKVIDYMARLVYDSPQIFRDDFRLLVAEATPDHPTQWVNGSDLRKLMRKLNMEIVPGRLGGSELVYSYSGRKYRVIPMSVPGDKDLSFAMVDVVSNDAYQLMSGIKVQIPMSDLSSIRPARPMLLETPDLTRPEFVLGGIETSLRAPEHMLGGVWRRGPAIVRGGKWTWDPEWVTEAVTRENLLFGMPGSRDFSGRTLQPLGFVQTAPDPTGPQSMMYFKEIIGPHYFPDMPEGRLETLMAQHEGAPLMAMPGENVDVLTRRFYANMYNVGKGAQAQVQAEALSRIAIQDQSRRRVRDILMTPGYGPREEIAQALLRVWEKGPEAWAATADMSLEEIASAAGMDGLGIQRYMDAALGVIERTPEGERGPLLKALGITSTDQAEQISDVARSVVFGLRQRMRDPKYRAQLTWTQPFMEQVWPQIKDWVIQLQGNRPALEMALKKILPTAPLQTVKRPAITVTLPPIVVGSDAVGIELSTLNPAAFRSDFGDVIRHMNLVTKAPDVDLYGTAGQARAIDRYQLTGKLREAGMENWMFEFLSGKGPWRYRSGQAVGIVEEEAIDYLAISRPTEPINVQDVIHESMKQQASEMMEVAEKYAWVGGKKMELTPEVVNSLIATAKAGDAKAMADVRSIASGNSGRTAARMMRSALYWSEESLEDAMLPFAYTPKGRADLLRIHARELGLGPDVIGRLGDHAQVTDIWQTMMSDEGQAGQRLRQLAHLTKLGDYNDAQLEALLRTHGASQTEYWHHMVSRLMEQRRERALANLPMFEAAPAQAVPDLVGDAMRRIPKMSPMLKMAGFGALALGAVYSMAAARSPVRTEEHLPAADSVQLPDGTFIQPIAPDPRGPIRPEDRLASERMRVRVKAKDFRRTDPQKLHAMLQDYLSQLSDTSKLSYNGQITDNSSRMDYQMADRIISQLM
jgi:hypothetical protein